MTRLRIGTRGSALARVQTEQVVRLVRDLDEDVEVEVVVIGVSGDERPTGVEGTPPALAPATAQPLDKSRWVDRIEQALLAGRIDLAVHSAKDVPGQLAPGLALLGAPTREDPRDALCGAGDLDSLAPGARVGTASVRRTAQLRALRTDLEVLDVRGNVDTRLRRLAEGGYDAIVLALAGLRRLGRSGEAGAALDAGAFVPAPGQGTLALEGCEDNPLAARIAAALSDPLTVAALTAERALVNSLGADCHTPVGAYARSPAGGRETTLELSAFVGLPDGSAWARDVQRAPAADADALGRRVGERLLAAGADELLAQAQAMAASPRA